jgi:putative transcriptional regulator
MSHVGRLLVATPLIGDPNFERTVVLLLAHLDAGAFGVILNRPSDTTVDEVVGEWAPWAAPPGAVFLGGPVGPSAVVGLGRCDAPLEGFEPLVGAVGTIDLNRPPEPGDPQPEAVRLFAGSAGWASGQLEDELAEGAWWLVDADADDVLTRDPSSLWPRVVRRQPGRVAWFANHPGDTSVN